MNKLISVIVPVYMAESYIKNCLDSLKIQTYENIEVLLINDGSTDTSGEICDYYAKKDSRFRVVHQNNKGVSNARNTGLSLSSGEFITFVDSDDIVSSDYIQNLLEGFLYQNIDVSACSYISGNDFSSIDWKSIDTVKEAKVILKSTEVVEDLCYSKFPFDDFDLTSVWGKMYRKSVVDGIRFKEDMIIGEDFAFNFKVYSKVSGVYCSNKKSYFYYVHGKSVMRTKKNCGVVETQENIEKLYNKYRNNNELNIPLLSRCVNMSFTLYLITADELLFAKKNIKKFIYKNRFKVLFNVHSKLKLKIALFISLFGLENVKRLHRLMDL